METPKGVETSRIDDQNSLGTMISNRYANSPGMIDLRTPQQLFNRISGFGEQRLPLMNSLHERYSLKTREGGGSPLPLFRWVMRRRRHLDSARIRGNQEAIFETQPGAFREQPGRGWQPRQADDLPLPSHESLNLRGAPGIGAGVLPEPGHRVTADGILWSSNLAPHSRPPGSTLARAATGEPLILSRARATRQFLCDTAPQVVPASRVAHPVLRLLREGPLMRADQSRVERAESSVGGEVAAIHNRMQQPPRPGERDANWPVQGDLGQLPTAGQPGMGALSARGTAQINTPMSSAASGGFGENLGSAVPLPLVRRGALQRSVDSTARVVSGEGERSSAGATRTEAGFHPAEPGDAVPSLSYTVLRHTESAFPPAPIRWREPADAPNWHLRFSRAATPPMRSYAITPRDPFFVGRSATEGRDSIQAANEQPPDTGPHLGTEVFRHKIPFRTVPAFRTASHQRAAPADGPHTYPSLSRAAEHPLTARPMAGTRPAVRPESAIAEWIVPSLEAHISARPRLKSSPTAAPTPDSRPLMVQASTVPRTPLRTVAPTRQGSQSTNPGEQFADAPVLLRQHSSITLPAAEKTMSAPSGSLLSGLPHMPFETLPYRAESVPGGQAHTHGFEHTSVVPIGFESVSRRLRVPLSTPTASLTAPMLFGGTGLTPIANAGSLTYQSPARIGPSPRGAMPFVARTPLKPWESAARRPAAASTYPALSSPTYSRAVDRVLVPGPSVTWPSAGDSTPFVRRTPLRPWESVARPSVATSTYPAASSPTYSRPVDRLLPVPSVMRSLPRSAAHLVPRTPLKPWEIVASPSAATSTYPAASSPTYSRPVDRLFVPGQSVMRPLPADATPFVLRTSLKPWESVSSPSAATPTYLAASSPTYSRPVDRLFVPGQSAMRSLPGDATPFVARTPFNPWESVASPSAATPTYPSAPSPTYSRPVDRLFVPGQSVMRTLPGDATPFVLRTSLKPRESVASPNAATSTYPSASSPTYSWPVDRLFVPGQSVMRSLRGDAMPFVARTPFSPWESVASPSATTPTYPVASSLTYSQPVDRLFVPGQSVMRSLPGDATPLVARTPFDPWQSAVRLSAANSNFLRASSPTFSRSADRVFARGHAVLPARPADQISASLDETVRPSGYFGLPTSGTAAMTRRAVTTGSSRHLATGLSVTEDQISGTSANGTSTGADDQFTSLPLVYKRPAIPSVDRGSSGAAIQRQAVVEASSLTQAAARPGDQMPDLSQDILSGVPGEGRPGAQSASPAAAPKSQPGGADEEQLIERVTRRLLRQLAIEYERRGVTRCR